MNVRESIETEAAFGLGSGRFRGKSKGHEE